MRNEGTPGVVVLTAVVEVYVAATNAIEVSAQSVLSTTTWSAKLKSSW